jgi:large subunit ribosomal protein L15
MQLHEVHQGIHKNKKRKRIGRGPGSGQGKTAGKGHKGHSSRQGFKYGALFEGGQITLARRVPKRGFTNGRFKKDYAIVNLDALDVFDAGAVVDEEALRLKGIVKGRHDDGVKILGDGEIKKALTVRAAKFSESAAKKLADAGGKAEVIGLKPEIVL